MREDDDIASLISRTALRDREAYERLYTIASPKLFGVCIRLLDNRSEAEDAMQDIFIKIWNKAESFRPSNASAMGWLYAIARNHCLDQLRALRMPVKSIDVAFNIADTLPSPEKNAVNAGHKLRIDNCMSELDPHKADAIRAAYVEGYSYAELAGRYDIPLNTMRTWLRRSLLKLRKCLEA